MRMRPLVVLVALGVALGSSAAAGTRDEWGPLRRPLHVPTVATGARCPVSSVDPRVPWARIRILGIGRGPVYPGLGAHSGLLWATRDVQSGGPWFGDKVFWFALPSYRGPILIRGRRLDGPQIVRFGGGKLPAAELRIERGESVSWQGQPPGSRGVASGVRVRTPGCYGFQIDGTSFSRVVVFTADLANYS